MLFWSANWNLTTRTLNHSPQLVVWKYGVTPAESVHSVWPRFPLLRASRSTTACRSETSVSMLERLVVSRPWSCVCTSEKFVMNESRSPVMLSSCAPTWFRRSRMSAMAPL